VLRAQWNIFLIAVMFLTRLPVGRWVRYEQSLLAHCTVYFPLVGAGVGAFGAGVLWLGAMLVPLPLAVLLSMLSTVLLTGAFHEDGLADSADGFGGASDAARVLEIMRDSRIGTYGAIALWFLLTTKWTLLMQLGSLELETAMLSLIVAHTAGRWSSLWLIWRLPYVRAESATSKPFASAVTASRFWLALLSFGAISLLCFRAFAFGIVGFAFLASFLSAKFAARRIGGITGDVLGAANQISEVSLYFVILIFKNAPNLQLSAWKFF